MRVVQKLLLLLPPFALFASGVIMLAASPFAWGVAEHVGLPAWMTTLSGLTFATPAIVIGGLHLRGLLRLMAEDFEANLFQLWFGLLLFSVSVALELALASRLGDGATYNTLKDDAGNDAVTPGAFLTITLFVSAGMAGLVAGAAYMYSEAISARSHRYDRRPNEVDNIGEMLRGRRDR